MLYDRTRRKNIVSKVEHCITPWQKSLGLMFSLPIKDECVIFHFDPPRKIDLHMFFVFYPIDVLFLDKSRKVVEIKERLMPFTMYMSKKKVDYAVELPNRTVFEKKITIGDRLTF